MERINLTDGSGCWFDRDKADRHEEGTWWNGSNHISLATDDQFMHECLYITASKKIIKNEWSQYQGSCKIYKLISQKDAFEWFQQNDYKEEDVPEFLREGFSAHLDETEIK